MSVTCPRITLKRFSTSSSSSPSLRWEKPAFGTPGLQIRKHIIMRIRIQARFKLIWIQRVNDNKSFTIRFNKKCDKLEKKTMLFNFWKILNFALAAQSSRTERNRFYFWVFFISWSWIRIRNTGWNLSCSCLNLWSLDSRTAKKTFQM